MSALPPVESGISLSRTMDAEGEERNRSDSLSSSDEQIDLPRPPSASENLEFLDKIHQQLITLVENHRSKSSPRLRRAISGGLSSQPPSSLVFPEPKKLQAFRETNLS